MATPRPVWNPDAGITADYHSHWQEVADNQSYDNAFKAEWELFLRHYQSWAERRMLDVPPLEG